MPMPSTDANALPNSAGERRWGLAAAIASVTVFGLSIGQGAPLLPLLLEARGTNVALNGLNAGAAFVGVIVGPLLAPRCVRWLGIRNFMLVCFGIDIALTLALKAFDGIAAWFVLRALLGLVGSSVFTTGEAWINLLAGDKGRGRIIGVYAAALSAGFGTGPLVLSLTGIQGWSPFVVNAAITAVAALPLLGAGDGTRGFGRERGANPLRMFARAPLIVGVVAIFGLFEAALMALLPIWGVRIGFSVRTAAATLTAVYFGSIVLQVLIGWLSDRLSRIAALRLCSVVGLVGAVMLLNVPASPLVLFGLLFAWGGVASGIYPVALSMAGDRFRGGDLVSVNAAMIIAYGLGGLAGPAMGGAAMDMRNPQGLLWLFVMLFAGLLAATCWVFGRGRRLDRTTE
ncbi:MAG TPA: MFS transporter [Acetobacteraceae bacterium]|jgi:MFS family permease|nr:MFS transporter [Acetobacteraceae bacterium]